MIVLSTTDKQLFNALCAVLLAIVDCEVIRVPTNRVSMPKGGFITMSPAELMPLSTNVDTYTETTKTITRPTQVSIQLDCYGAGSADRAVAISMLLRDDSGCELFAAQPGGIQPLYATDPAQLPLVNGEEQYEQRWMFKAVLQYNPALSVEQQSANELSVDFISAVRKYAP